MTIVKFEDTKQNSGGWGVAVADKDFSKRKEK